MIWYPYVQMKHMKAPYKIVDAEGVYLYTHNNKKLIDSISSWWSVIHGYKNFELNRAITNQVQKFSHIMLGGLSHEPVEQLSQKLSEWLPGDLNYCFFSDSGSVAVEVALKMAIQYFINSGENERTITLALNNAYHGDTFKAMEVGDDEDYHFILKAIGRNENIIHIPADIESLEKVFEKYNCKLNSFIVEPLLQCAGGFHIHSLSFLKKARELCSKNNVLLIFDEVATGFGRTGQRFVADLIEPDILILGKALTGGYIGHAVTVANKKVFNKFYDNKPEHAFMHGPTFMGNALACSVALKSIEIFERENYIEKIRNIEKIGKREFQNFSAKGIKDIRILGGCVCIECEDSRYIEGFQEFAYNNGIFNRPFLKYIYTMPPYIINESELIKIFDVMKAWFN